MDGKVRKFSVCKPIDAPFQYISEAQCLECGEYFGFHDTAILKPEFKKHVCLTESVVVKR